MSFGDYPPGLTPAMYDAYWEDNDRCVDLEALIWSGEELTYEEQCDVDRDSYLTEQQELYYFWLDMVKEPDITLVMDYKPQPITEIQR
jgi:hypothetical protein